MRVPHTINLNTLKAYEVPPDIYIREERIKSDDFTWDINIPISLRELCLYAICENWKKYPVYREIKVPFDRSILLEILPTNIPLELTVPKIVNDVYWERCYYDKWPNSPAPIRNISNKIHIRWQSIASTEYCDEKHLECSDSIKNEFSEEDNLNNEDNEFCGRRFSLQSQSTQRRRFSVSSRRYSWASQSQKYSMMSKSTKSSKENTASNLGSENSLVSSKIIEENSLIESVVSGFDLFYREPRIKSWKRCFLERFLQEEIEKMEPDNSDNPEHIKELTDLCGYYVTSLNLRQLRSSKDEDCTDHISLHSLLARLPCLAEFSVCFNQANLGDAFSWHATKISDADCKALGNGIGKSNVQIFRILRSNINCHRLKLILRSISIHKSLRILDLSHCRIADDGCLAIAEILKGNSVIETIILTNNKIGPKGAQGLAYYLCKEDSTLIDLDLTLNPIEAEGGKYLTTALLKGAKYLRILSLASCGLTNDNIQIGDAIALNTTLQKLDLSNNHLGEDIGHSFLKGLENNKTLLKLDLRRTEISPEMMNKIDSKVKKNYFIARGIMRTV